MKPSELRQEIADQLRASLADLGWHESDVPYDMFPQVETRYGHHLHYAIGLVQSEALAGNQRRHLAMSTTVGVRWTYTLRANEYLASYDEALDREYEMLVALASLKDAAGQQPLRVQTVTREMQPLDGYHLFLGEVQGPIPHPICLT